ncbi:LLM class flavin-dependent oxidoreductase [Chryseobacterium sp. JJR-5R]|uniref:LLM class flavin-dependent oxidoreductase n=1 Tax=Chryseobacterium sp. JJR-5R TaxID=3093923 RepID=UPI002A763634|nr:LLM class flavin-dependent oxidoreductase [Chryseobacterium sp. JJR-5R]WPO84176.1 LLM class flavin-dependent oxidoreductase [Chryseobacterium sp. JJR-5R]
MYMKNKIDYSILELAIVSEGSTFQDTLNNAIALAKVAEQNDYKRFWFAEHHNSAAIVSSATSILISFVAGQTSKIRVGSGGIMLPNHSPLIIAEQFGTLAQLYPDRIDLGLGRASGTDQVTAQAIRSDNMAAAHSFPEEVQKIQTYFSEDNKLSKVRVAFAEGAEVPLYILGSSTDSAHLAAAKGLPYAFASHFATSQLHDALRIYAREFQASDEHAFPYTMAGINVIVADTDEQAERLLTSLIIMFNNMQSGKSLPLSPPTDMNDELRAVFNHPNVQQMLKFSFVGSKDTVKKKILSFLHDTNADELITVSTIFNLEDRIRSIRLFAELMEEINGKHSN